MKQYLLFAKWNFYRINYLGEKDERSHHKGGLGRYQ